jgi:hypothetical protein
MITRDRLTLSPASGLQYLLIMFSGAYMPSCAPRTLEPCSKAATKQSKLLSTTLCRIRAFGQRPLPGKVIDDFSCCLFANKRRQFVNAGF